MIHFIFYMPAMALFSFCILNLVKTPNIASALIFVAISALYGFMMYLKLVKYHPKVKRSVNPEILKLEQVVEQARIKKQIAELDMERGRLEKSTEKVMNNEHRKIIF